MTGKMQVKNALILLALVGCERRERPPTWALVIPPCESYRVNWRGREGLQVARGVKSIDYENGRVSILWHNGNAGSDLPIPEDVICDCEFKPPSNG